MALDISLQPVATSPLRPVRWLAQPHWAARLPLLAVLGLQAIASLSLGNTAFQDEGIYLYAGRDLARELFGGAPAGDPYAEYFSGLPYLYPVLAGALDAIAGLEAARLLSLIVMLWATAAVYLFTEWGYGRDGALLAAALFGVQGSVLFIGRLATYDAMCLGLLALAMVLSLRAGAARGVAWVWGVGVTLCLAVAAKYAGLLYVPVVLAILGWQAWKVNGWRAALVRPVLAGATIVAGLAAVVAADDRVLVALRTTTTERVAYLHTTALALGWRSATLIGPIVLLAAAGLLMGGRKRLPLALVLFGTAFLAPAYHIYKAEPTSLNKHVAFGVLFAAPLAGYALAGLSGCGRPETVGRRWLAGLAVCLLLFSLGQSQARTMYAEWPHSDALVRTLRTVVRPDSGRILAEESEVTRYYLQDVVSFWQWNQLYWFYYTDAAGRNLSGVPAYQAAIAEAYFDVVVLRYGPSASVAYAIDHELRSERRYELIARLPFETAFGPGAHWVWRKKVGQPAQAATAAPGASTQISAFPPAACRGAATQVSSGTTCES